MYSVRDVEAENFQKDGVEYDFVTGDGVASSAEMTYYSIHDEDMETAEIIFLC